MNKRENLIYFAIKYNGEYKKILDAYKNNLQGDKVYNVNAITILDDNYPKQLLDLTYPPIVLFYKGDISIINSKCISIVGSRIVNEYGEKMCSQITHCLSKKYTVVSGLAKGIDSLAHKHSLKNGKTIGILGCGIDYIYPKCNSDLYYEMEKYHLILSEYPFDTEPTKFNFPWRNRIIAALSESLIVIQAKQYSGTMLTVNEALKLDRTIYALPHRIDDELGAGCNFLIQEGASILLTEDIHLI